MTQPVGSLDIAWAGLTLIARIRGEVDLSNAPGFEEEISLKLSRGVPLVIDLTLTSYFDSSGVRMLSNLVEAAERNGRGIRVVAPDGGAARYVLRICAFREDLLAESPEQALESLDADPGT